MIKDFECLECGKRFKADEAGDVLCPACNSDNVQYAKFRLRLPKWAKWVALGVVALAAIVAAIIYLIPEKSDTETTEDEGTAEIEARMDSTFLSETGLTIPASLIVGTPEFEDDGYTITVSIKDAPQCSMKYVILQAFADKVVAESPDGKFSGVPFSKDKGGLYRVAAICTANDSTLASQEVAGFIRQVKVSTKMTAAELQSKINSRDPSLVGVGENDYLNPAYTIKYSGLSAGAVNIPKILAEVFDKLDMGSWTSVSVTGLEYDDMNRINVIKLSVKESSDDF